MLQLLLSILTLIGLSLDLRGAILVLVPDSRTAQRIVRARDDYKSMRHLRGKLQSGEVIQSHQSGFDDLINILSDKYDYQEHSEYIVVTDGDSIVDSFEYDERELDRLIAMCGQNGILTSFTWGKYDIEQGSYESYPEKIRDYIGDRDFILFFGKNNQGNKEFVNILERSRISNIDEHLRQRMLTKGAYSLLIGFGIQLVAQFIRVLTQPTISSFISRALDSVLYILQLY